MSFNLEEKHNLVVKEPSGWLIKAEALFISAKKIYNENKSIFECSKEELDNNTSDKKISREEMYKFFLQQKLVRISYMLAAYSIENLLKCIYCKENEGKNSKELIKDVKQHNLNSLVNIVKEKIEMNNERQEFLNRLTENATWLGRYPCPIKKESLDRNHNGQRLSFSDKTFNQFEEFYNELQGIIEKLLSNKT